MLPGIMSVPIIFDHDLRAARHYRERDEAFLREQLELRAFERIEALTIQPLAIGILGRASQNFHRQLQQLFPGASITLLVIDPAEHLQNTQSFTLIIDLGTLALVNDLPGMLIQIRQALQPNGKFVSLLYGGNSLSELREALLTAETNLRGGAAPRLHPALNLESAITLLQRTGFTQPVADREPLSVTYPDIRTLAHDLRAAGLTNSLVAQSRTVPPRTLFVTAEAQWRDKAGTGRLPASFDVISLSGWKSA